MPIARFRLPDGRIARFEVPEGLSPEQAEALVAPQLAELSTPEPAPTEDTGFFDMMGRAVTRGAKQTGSLLGDVLPAMAAKAIGADEYAAEQMEEAAQTQKEIEQKYGARYKELSDVKGLGDVLPFVAETVAEQIPNLATAIIPGVGGGAIAARTAAGLVGKEAAKRVAMGQGVGTFLGSYALNAPEVFQNIAEETGELNVGAAALAGSVSAALDSFLPAYLVRQFTPGMKAGVVERILERSGMPPGIARQATAGVLTGVATEGPTEAAQEAISIAAEKFVADNADAWGSKEFNRLVESGVRGAVGGGGISGIAGAGKGYLDKRAAAKAAEPPPPPGGKSALDELDDFDEATGQRVGTEETTAPTPAEGMEGVIAEAQKRWEAENAARQKAARENLESLLKNRPDPDADIPGFDVPSTDGERTSTGVDAGAGEPGVSVPSGAATVSGARPGVAGATGQQLGGAGRSTFGTREGEGTVTPPVGGDVLPTGIPPEQMAEMQKAKERQTKQRAQKLNTEIEDQALTNAGLTPSEIYDTRENPDKNLDVLEGVGLGMAYVTNPDGSRTFKRVTEQDVIDAKDMGERARLRNVINSRPFGKPAEFTRPTAAEKALTRKDFLEAGFSQAQALALEQQAQKKEIGPKTKEIFQKVLASRTGGQELLFSGPQRGLDFDAAMEEGADLTPKAPAQQGLELAPAEEGVSRELPAIERPEFELGRGEGTVAEVSPEMQRLADVENWLDDVAGFAAPYVSREQKADLPTLLTEFLSQYDQITNPERVARALSSPDSRGARAAAEGMADVMDLEKVRREFQAFAADRGLQKLGYSPEKSAAGLLERSHDLQTAGPRVIAILRALRSMPRAMMDSGQKAAMAYFTKFNYDVAMKSAAYDIANNIAEGSIVPGQGVRTGQQFREYLEENFPAAEVEYFDALVEAHKTSLKRAASAVKRMAQRQDKLSALKKYANMPTKEIERYLSTQPLRSGGAAALKPMHPMVMERIQNNDLNGALAMLSAYSDNAYYKTLAKRLLDLDLPTGVYVNREQDMINALVAEVNPALEQFMKYFSEAYPEAFEQLFQNANVYKIAKGLQELQENGIPRSAKSYFSPMVKTEQLPQDVLENTAYQRLFSVYESVVPSLTADGFYAPKLDAINLNTKFDGNSYYVFLHEIIHAATANALRNPEALNASQKKALDELNRMYDLAQQNIKFEAYGLSNLDEFIAEAFTNKSFQNLLRGLKYKDTDTSVWSKFIRTVMNLLGIERDSVLFGTLHNADILMSGNRPPLKEDAFGKSLLDARVPKPKKSATFGTFKTAPDAPDTRRPRAWLESTLKRPSWNAVKNNLPAWLENLTDSSRKYYLGAFTLRQLKDLAGERIPMLGRFIDTVESMLDERNTILQNVSDITKRWETYQAANPEKTKKLNMLMIDATLAGVDPASEPGKDAGLDEIWNSLDETAQKIYTEVRDFYAKRVADYRATILKNVELAMVADNKSAAEIQATLKELQDRFNKNTKQPYFPLKRFGKYWLQFGKGKNKEFYMFESIGQRNKFRDAELKKRGIAVDDKDAYDYGSDITNMVKDNLKDIEALKAIKDIVDSAVAKDGDTLQAAIKESLDQLYLLTLPDKSVRKMFINRKEIQGASADMLRAFTVSAFHMAYQHSRFKHARDMYGQINAARGYMEGKLPAERNVDRDYIKELENRLNYIMNPTDTGLIPSTLSNISFIYFLTAPASALVNMLGVPAIGLPVVAARFGWGKSSATLSAYAKRFLGTGFKNAEGKYEAPTMQRANLTELERRAYDKFVKDGVIDVTLAHDLAGMAEAPTNLYTGNMHKVMRGLSYMFHNAEKFNREVMAMAAFKMAYDKTGSFDQAVEQAKDLTYRSMFDYSTLNKPRYFQNSYAKVILQFKQFSQQMTYLLARSAYEAFKGESKEVRREARDRVLGTLGMTFLFAGATGMPLFSVGAATIEALHAAFSDDDEPPLDFENWFKNWMAETFGSFVGDSISRGVITQASGVNFADRMSLNDLWFRDTRKSQDEVTALQNMFINMLGPTAGLAVNGAEALKALNDGHYYRAAEKALPAFLKQPLIGARYATEGALTMKGDELVSDISGKEALGQMLGFSPERVAQRQKANIEAKTEEQRILNQRQDLLNAFFMAIDSGDDDMRERVLEKIGRFNRMYPTVGIKGSTLSKSIKTRYKQRAMAELSGGTPIDKRLMSALSEMSAYGEPD